MSKWKERHWPKVEDCNSGAGQRALGAKDLMGVFITALCGMGTALLVLITEIIFFKVKPPDAVSKLKGNSSLK